MARDHLAARERWPPQQVPEEFASPLPGGDVTAVRADIRSRVEAAIAGLPEQQRTAIRLCDVDGYDASEAATMMGVTAGTVRSHLHHARRALRAALAAFADRVDEQGD